MPLVLYSYQASVSDPFGFTLPPSWAVLSVTDEADPVTTNGGNGGLALLSINSMVGTIPRLAVSRTVERQTGAGAGISVRVFVSSVGPPDIQVGAFRVPS
jgi:hypothetical protein